MIHYRVVLVEPEFDETIGFVARTMKNFGISELRLVNPIAKLSSTTHSRASHAQDIIEDITYSHSLVDSLIGTDLTVGTSAQISHSTSRLLRRPIEPKELSKVLESTRGSVALVFGREGTGLTNQELGLCDIVVKIPSSLEYPTLNLSHAAAIMFYELFQVTSVKSEEFLADEATKQKILELLGSLASSTGMKQYKVGISVKALRNILGRSAIRRREASILAGVFRKILEYSTRQREKSDSVPYGDRLTRG